MHGSIFVFLKRFVETQHDFSTWQKLLENADLTDQNFDLHTIYPDEDLYRIVHEASALTGLDRDSLYEKFGEFLIPDLLLMYNRYIDPNWRTMDMIEYTESTMHTAVRKEDAGTDPPVLHVTRLQKNKLIIDYYSKRKMGSLAVGMIKGIAKYYNEAEFIDIEAITSQEGERVQIRVNQTEKPEA
jgi:hypothetical protein